MRGSVILNIRITHCFSMAVYIDTKENPKQMLPNTTGAKCGTFPATSATAHFESKPRRCRFWATRIVFKRISSNVNRSPVPALIYVNWIQEFELQLLTHNRSNQITWAIFGPHKSMDLKRIWPIETFTLNTHGASSLPQIFLALSNFTRNIFSANLMIRIGERGLLNRIHFDITRCQISKQSNKEKPSIYRLMNTVHQQMTFKFILFCTRSACTIFE